MDSGPRQLVRRWRRCLGGEGRSGNTRASQPQVRAVPPARVGLGRPWASTYRAEGHLRHERTGATGKKSSLGWWGGVDTGCCEARHGLSHCRGYPGVSTKIAFWHTFVFDGPFSTAARDARIGGESWSGDCDAPLVTPALKAARSARGEGPRGGGGGGGRYHGEGDFFSHFAQARLSSQDVDERLADARSTTSKLPQRHGSDAGSNTLSSPRSCGARGVRRAPGRSAPQDRARRALRRQGPLQLGLEEPSRAAAHLHTALPLRD